MGVLTEDNSELYVLVVQRHQESLLKIAQYLNRWGFNCDCTKDARSAVSCLRDGLHDLILIDEENGPNKLTRVIREIERRLDRDPVPILSITSDAVQESDEDDDIPNDRLNRPVHPKTLRLMIYYWLGNIWKFRSIQRAYNKKNIKSL